MTGHQLAHYRKQKKRTQVETARALGVSQTYLSLLEAGKRPLNKRLQKRAARIFELPPTELPARLLSGELPSVTDDQLAADLADLGYPGFAHLRRKRQRRKNPADVLLSGLNARQRDARIMEAMPWLALTFPGMRWTQLMMLSKSVDLQNRLGFVVSLARELAEERGETKTSEVLQAQEHLLERSRLAREDTLCNDAMTKAERNWLATHRTANAKHWGILTSLSPKLVRYAN